MKNTIAGSFLLLAISFAQTSWATNIYVPGNYSTIQAAISAAANGDIEMNYALLCEQTEKNYIRSLKNDGLGYSAKAFALLS